ncbi:MAG: P-loop NTPase [Bacillota bacterium]
MRWVVASSDPAVLLRIAGEGGEVVGLASQPLLVISLALEKEAQCCLIDSRCGDRSVIEAAAKALHTGLPGVKVFVWDVSGQWPEEAAAQDGITLWRPPAPVAAAEPPKANSGAAEPPSVMPPQVITVFSPKGGVGKSFIAANLAALLALRAGMRTAVVDLDLDCGDQSVCFNLPDGPTITDLLPGLKSVRGDPPELPRHRPSGAHVLLAPHHPELAEFVEPGDIERLISALARNFQLVVIDTAPGLDNEVTYKALELSNAALLVVNLCPSSLKAARTFLGLRSRLGLTDLRLEILANRVTGNSAVSPTQGQSFLGQRFLAQIREDPAAGEALIAGDPVTRRSPESPAAEDLVNLARRLFPQLPLKARQEGPAWRRWARRIWR